MPMQPSPLHQGWGLAFPEQGGSWAVAGQPEVMCPGFPQYRHNSPAVSLQQRSRAKLGLLAWTYLVVMKLMGDELESG